MNDGRQLLNKLIEKGHVLRGNRLYTPSQAKELNIEPSKPKRSTRGLRTCDTGDPLNIKNKAKADQFTRLIEIELNQSIWPEFYFVADRKWRFDYCLPEYKIAIECEGGIYSNGRHVRGKGYENDMEKYSRAAIEGWLLIRVTPTQLLTLSTINLIKTAIENKQP